MRLALGGTFDGLRQICILVIAFSTMLPLCLLRDISGLEAFSSLSISIVILVCIFVFIKMCIKLDSGSKSTSAVSAEHTTGLDLVFAEGVVSFAFVCQNCAFFYYNTLREVSAFLRLN